MRIPSRALVVVFLISTSFAMSPALASNDRQALTTCDGTWQVVSSPNVGQATYLEDVSADSSTDAWAVGEYQTTNGYDRTLVEHWDGVTWTVVSSPNPGPLFNYLADVVALSPADVWAVGVQAGVGTSQTLVEHWDGTSWIVVPSVNVGNGENGLFGVGAIGADDVWAVGHQFSTRGSLLVEHWDGTAWTRVPAGHRANSSHDLEAVAGVATDDVWAVGDTTTIGGGPTRTLAEHWDGAAWTIAPTVNPEEKHANVLVDVAAPSSTDVWSVGSYEASLTSNQSLIEHWDGNAWSLVASADATSDDFLLGVSADSGSDAWAVGIALDHGLSQTLIEHWDGAAWAVAPAPSPFPRREATWRGSRRGHRRTPGRWGSGTRHPVR